MYKVSSEIFAETDFQQVKNENGRTVSKFRFQYPIENQNSKVLLDDDGDLVVPRRKEGAIIIEHSDSTILKFVGLQVWRGALLLADFIFHHRHDEFATNKKILELGAGVGLTSIAAGVFGSTVICSDVDIGGILDLIRANIKANRKLIRNDIDVIEIDFRNFDLIKNQNGLVEVLDDVDVVMAADVIYDDDLTDCLIDVIDKLLTWNFHKEKIIYIALEKRYVFTVADLETTAPCYHYFRTKAFNKQWNILDVPIDFPQYFQYERCKELVLLKISKKK